MSSLPSSSRFVFPRWANYLLPVAIIAALGGGLYVPVVAYLGMSPDAISVGYQPPQPVAYSHEIHVGQLGMDCRYCHNTVEKAGFASVPPTQTCITCHAPTGAAIKKDSPRLKPVRDSHATGEPIRWNKVHDLADYVYFNHSAHVNSGVGCVTCHGRVDQMGEPNTPQFKSTHPVPGVYQAKNLSMGWCLECHREPEKFLRPREEVTNMTWTPPTNPGESADAAQLRMGLELKEKYNIHGAAYMQACSTCHR